MKRKIIRVCYIFFSDLKFECEGNNRQCCRKGLEKELMKLNDKFIVDNKNDKLRRKKNVTDINKDNIDGGKKFFPPKYVSNTMEIHFPFNLLNEL